MENKVTIKQQLNAIVYAELKGLIKVVDEWFNDTIDHGVELVLGTSSNDAPIINLYTEFNDVAQYYVKGIAGANEGYYLELIPTAYDNFDDENVKAHYIEGDWCNAREFIPGEIDRLTDEVLKAIHPEEECYHFSNEQMDAIKQFNSALKNLHEKKVCVFSEVDTCKFKFAVDIQNGHYINPSDDEINEGKEMVDVDTNELPTIECELNGCFYEDDTLVFVKD